jgi:hypothetical protein
MVLMTVLHSAQTQMSPWRSCTFSIGSPPEVMEQYVPADWICQIEKQKKALIQGAESL